MLNNYFKALCNEQRFEKSYRIIENMFITVISNSESALMENYFSKSMISCPINVSLLYTVFIIDTQKVEIDEKVKKLCKKSSLRSKRMSTGYYNLNHFGEEVTFYHDKEEKAFYVAGNQKDCSKVFWSYIMKWILTEYTLKTGIHYKASLIEKNGDGILIIGGKSSGKSSLIHEVIDAKRGFSFLSNTHVIMNNDVAYGIHSNINFRKEMAEYVCKKNKKLKYMKIKGCTNLDPVDLNYEIKADCVIKYIMFYQYNQDGDFNADECSKDVMRKLLQTYADALNVYSLRDDLLTYENGNIEHVANILEHYNTEMDNIVMNTKNYILTADIKDEKSREQVMDFLGKIG